MRHGFGVLALAVLAVCLSAPTANLSADQPAHQAAYDDGAPGWGDGSWTRTAGYYAYRSYYRRSYGGYGGWRPYRRYVYRCRRFSYQCSYRLVGGIVSDTYYSAYRYVDYRRSAPGPRASKADMAAPARLGRYYAYPWMRESADGAYSGSLGSGVYAGQQVKIQGASGGFVRISSPGRSARWARMELITGE
jgi:hypothetical protein